MPDSWLPNQRKVFKSRVGKGNGNLFFSTFLLHFKKQRVFLTLFYTEISKKHLSKENLPLRNTAVMKTAAEEDYLTDWLSYLFLFWKVFHTSVSLLSDNSSSPTVAGNCRLFPISMLQFPTPLIGNAHQGLCSLTATATATTPPLSNGVKKKGSHFNSSQ